MLVRFVMAEASAVDQAAQHLGYGAVSVLPRPRGVLVISAVTQGTGLCWSACRRLLLRQAGGHGLGSCQLGAWFDSLVRCLQASSELGELEETARSLGCLGLVFKKQKRQQ